MLYKHTCVDLRSCKAQSSHSLKQLYFWALVVQMGCSLQALRSHLSTDRLIALDISLQFFFSKYHFEIIATTKIMSCSYTKKFQETRIIQEGIVATALLKGHR